jgi:hypothetical protein
VVVSDQVVPGMDLERVALVVVGCSTAQDVDGGADVGVDVVEPCVDLGFVE